MWPNLTNVILTTKTMAKYGKNNYFDGVILPEPKEEMLRRMAKGVKMGYDQHIDKTPLTSFKSPSMPIGTNDFTLEYFGNLYGAIKATSPLIFNNKSPYAFSKGCLLIYGTSEFAVQWIIFESPMSGGQLLDSIELNVGVQEDILHIVLTRNGTTVKVYINGELKATKEQSAVKDLGDFRLGMANSSNIIMSRIYNYAIPIEEVVAHYNNGHPADYILPAADKYLEPVEVSGDNSYTWTGADDPTYSFSVLCSRYFKTKEWIKIRATVSNYESGPTPYFKISSLSTAYLLDFKGDGIYEVYIKAIGVPYRSVLVYAGILGSDRRLTITVDSVESIGCTAEYLPHNLIPTAQGDVLQWFDSAPQFPEANGILPPLDASVGGYDLQVTGNPKIII